MKTIFAVDDQDFNLTVIATMLEEQYRVLTASSAEKMFTLLKKITPDLILLDIEMPEINGFDALKQLKANEFYSDIPVVFLTGRTDELTESQGFELGAIDFITKPFSKMVLMNRIQTHLNIDELIREKTELLKQKELEVRKIRNGIVSVLSDIVESRDKVTDGHIVRTTSYTALLIEAMIAKKIYAEQMRDWNLTSTVASASLHDIGKIAVSDLILNKPGKLTPEEFEQVKMHATEGMKIIDRVIERTGLSDSFLIHAKLFAGQHHERWDGTGYPQGLKGEEISLEGRILAIADVYDALVSDRPYKNAFSHEKAVGIIMDDAGEHFDPKIAEVFFEIKDKFDEVRKSL
ncbi:MAG: response regulator [Chitinivibrionia bacterium]|nr:response regulator [Chitinivibrionia bacterium]